MTWDGSGTHNRVHNFSADASAGIQAQAVRFDAEFNDISTALENCQTLTGETTPTANSPMGGFKHTGVAAATSTDNYLRSDQASQQVGIFVRDVNTGVTGAMTASAAIFPTAFTEGQRVTVKVSANGSTSAPRSIKINGLSANIIDNRGSAFPASQMLKDGYFDLVYDASASSFRTLTPRNDSNALVSAPPAPAIKVKIADSSVASSTTVSDDTHLTGIALTTGKSHIFEAFVPWFENGGDIKYQFAFTNAPQKSTAVYLEHSQIGGEDLGDMVDDMTLAVSHASVTGNIEHGIVMRGYILANSSAGGTFKFQWAQLTSNANATIVRSGAWMKATATD